jgi:hypothetical protein
MKITLARACILIAIAPLVVGLSAMALHALLGCAGGVGPGITECKYASHGVGEALKGLGWTVFVCVVSIPLALTVAVVGKILGLGAREGKSAK